jgi:hypothetical protein
VIRSRPKRLKLTGKPHIYRRFMSAHRGFVWIVRFQKKHHTHNDFSAACYVAKLLWRKSREQDAKAKA